MSTIKHFFEQEVIKKIQASNDLDKKLKESRLGFNRGISYLENLCEQLQEHIPTLGCQLEVEDDNTSGNFIFDANNCRIVIKFWGRYNNDGSERIRSNAEDFTLFYKNKYWGHKQEFEKLLVSDIVNNLNVIQMQ
jgi:hypothetical protein